MWTYLVNRKWSFHRTMKYTYVIELVWCRLSTSKEVTHFESSKSRLTGPAWNRIYIIMIFTSYHSTFYDDSHSVYSIVQISLQRTPRFRGQNFRSVTIHSYHDIIHKVIFIVLCVGWFSSNTCQFLLQNLCRIIYAWLKIRFIRNRNA